MLGSDERRGVREEARVKASRARGEEQGRIRIREHGGMQQGKSWMAPNNSGFHPKTNKEPLADLQKDYFRDRTEDSRTQRRGGKLPKLVKSLFNG